MHILLEKRNCFFFFKSKVIFNKLGRMSRVALELFKWLCSLVFCDRLILKAAALRVICANVLTIRVLCSYGFSHNVSHRLFFFQSAVGLSGKNYEGIISLDSLLFFSLSLLFFSKSSTTPSLSLPSTLFSASSSSSVYLFQPFTLCPPPLLLT